MALELQNKFSTEIVHIDYRKIKPFQGGLKVQDDDEYRALKSSLEKRGVLGPMYVWKKPKTKTWYTFDGHQRLKVYNHEDATFDGKYEVPCIEVKAATEEQAREYLLALNGRYARVTEEGMIEFVGEMALESLSDIMLPDIGDLDFIGDFRAGRKAMAGDMLNLDEFGDEVAPDAAEVPDEIKNREPSLNDTAVLYFAVTYEQKQVCQNFLSSIKAANGHETLGESLYYVITEFQKQSK